MTTRTAGLRGRLPVKPEGEKFAIRWVADYAAQPLPAPAYPVDVSGGVSDWGMCGNGPDPACTTHPDGVGDCTFAGRQHARMAKAAAGAELAAETWETPDELVAEYLAYDHGSDDGANIADLLLYWYKAGKILAFAPVDHADPAAVDAAMAAFHGCYAGVSLTDDADALFGSGQPWTVAGGQQPDPAAGHCIVRVAADGREVDTYVTWGALQPATRDWSAACLDEAWVIITAEDAAAASLDIAALRADINALGGTGGSGAPAAEPSVPVHPVTLLSEVIADLEAVLGKARAWMFRHGI
jgi:hypothetical protein